MTTLTESVDIILKAAARLEKLAQLAPEPKGEPKTSAQPADIQNALQSAGLFGGKGPPGKKNYSAGELAFDPNSRTAKLIFGLMDSMNPPYEGKMGATLTVSSKGDVTINITGDRAKELAPKMQRMFGPSMSKALKIKKVFPAGSLAVGWLVNVG